MTVCNDVYVLPQDTCTTGVLFLYPSQGHPHRAGRPHGAFVKREHHRIPPERRLGAEDELAVILLLESFTTSG